MEASNNHQEQVAGWKQRVVPSRYLFLSMLLQELAHLCEGLTTLMQVVCCLKPLAHLFEGRRVVNLCIEQYQSTCLCIASEASLEVRVMPRSSWQEKERA